MAVIRRINCFDAPRIKKMVSYLDSDISDVFIKTLTSHALSVLHSAVPLRCKFLPETFIFLEGNEILGIITVTPTRGNPFKINITRLIFKQNYYEVGKQLVEFVISRFGAKGATSFHVTVDQSHDELLNLFLNGCGFRQCSYENLWKIENYHPETSLKAEFRYCQNSDAKHISRLYNAELKSIFRPSLERKKR